MRFLCQHCKSKYTISDDKIRNKRLKIRCKKCHNVIEIIDPYRSVRHSSIPTGGPLLDEPVSLVMPDPDEPSIVSNSSPAPHSLEDQFAASFQKNPESSGQTVGTPGLLSNLKQQAANLEKDETEQPIWFVAINNAPVGPTTARAIHKYRRTGRVTDDSLSWKEGMPDWMPLRNCKELIGLLARIDLTESPSPSEAPAKKSEPKLGLFGEGSSKTDPLKGSRVGVIGAPKAPPPEETAISFPEEEDDETVSFGQQSDKETDTDYETDVSRLHSLTPPRSGGNRVYLLASVGFFITALVTLMVVISGGGESSAETQSSVQTVEKIVEKVVYRDRIVEKEVYKEPEDEQASNSKTKKHSNGQGMAARSRKVQKKLPSDDKTRELMARLSMNTPSGRGPIGGTKTNRSANDIAPTNSALTANQMKRVVNQNKGALKTCYERSLKKGEAPDNKDLRVNFKLTVGKSGMVKSVTFGGAGAKLPTLKSCLNRSVKQWIFPASKGESDLEFPFVFTPTK